MFDSQRGTSARWIRLLDVDPDLGAQLDQQSAREARAELVTPLARIEWRTHKGDWRPMGRRGDVLVLITDGLMLREVSVVGTTSAELLGRGDLLRPWCLDGPDAVALCERVSWTVLSPASVALLDVAFLRRAARWPDVIAALIGRAVMRAKSLAFHEAITNAKHVETRLLVQFWHLAERWGHVNPHGVSLVLPVTHEMLAKLVGASRPSVSTALRRLSERHLVRRDAPGVWRLSREIPNVLGDDEPVPTAKRADERLD